MKTIDPASGELVRTWQTHGRDEVEARVAGVVRAQQAWKRAGFEERAAPLQRMAAELHGRRDELALLAAEEMGKPLTEGRAEIDKCARACGFYAERAAELLADRPIESEARRSYVTHLPLGVVLAVMPWNFPFWQVFRFAAPALMAGNGVLLKHAPNVCGVSVTLEELFGAAGFPDGLFASLLVEEDVVGELLGRREVAAATLTGSPRAGRAVAAAAGAALKPTVLELGGSDPYVVLADADLEAALDGCVRSRLQNGGQSCIAAKRLVVVAERHDAFLEGLVERMGRVRSGDPRDETTELGPLARTDLRENLHRQVRESLAAGARLALGGEPAPGSGFFYPPTVLVDVGPGMPAYEEELFGPVAAVLNAEDEADALRIANDTPYGLGAAVFTADVERGERIAARELEAGSCFVNDFVRSDPRFPFGGVRDSGYGRELSAEGILEFVNTKTVWVA